LGRGKGTIFGAADNLTGELIGKGALSNKFGEDGGVFRFTGSHGHGRKLHKPMRKGDWCGPKRRGKGELNNRIRKKVKETKQKRGAPRKCCQKRDGERPMKQKRRGGEPRADTSNSPPEREGVMAPGKKYG